MSHVHHRPHRTDDFATNARFAGGALRHVWLRLPVAILVTAAFPHDVLHVALGPGIDRHQEIDAWVSPSGVSVYSTLGGTPE